MFDILQKAGRGVKKFMSEKINTCKEILSSAQNRLIIGLVMIGTGVGFVASAYIRVPKEQILFLDVVYKDKSFIIDRILEIARRL